MRRRGIVLLALPILGAALAAPAHADPVADALATVAATVGAQSAVCATSRSLDLRHLSWYVDSTTAPGTISYVWNDSARADVTCAGVMVAIRIRDYAGAGTVNVGGGGLIYETGWCYGTSGGTSATAACPGLSVPYYSPQQIRNTSTVIVDAVAWNRGVQYSCRTAVYMVVATPTGPEFLLEDTGSDCATA